MSQIRLEAWAGELTCLEVDAPGPLDPEVSERIDAIWERERAEREGPLWDGILMSVQSRSPRELKAYPCPYRYWIAQLRDPELAEILGVRALAVTGVVRVADGFVLGRRAPHTTQDPSFWELCPSGGVGIGSRAGGTTLDPRRQLKEESAEELGLTTSLEGWAPAWIVDDDPSRVVDLVFTYPISTSAEALLERARERIAQQAKPELTRVEWVDEPSLRKLLTQPGEDLAPVSRRILEAYGFELDA